MFIKRPATQAFSSRHKMGRQKAIRSWLYVFWGVFPYCASQPAALCTYQSTSGQNDFSKRLQLRTQVLGLQQAHCFSHKPSARTTACLTRLPLPAGVFRKHLRWRQDTWLVQVWGETWAAWPRPAPANCPSEECTAQSQAPTWTSLKWKI